MRGRRQHRRRTFCHICTTHCTPLMLDGSRKTTVPLAASASASALAALAPAAAARSAAAAAASSSSRLAASGGVGARAALGGASVPSTARAPGSSGATSATGPSSRAATIAAESALLRRLPPPDGVLLRTPPSAPKTGSGFKPGSPSAPAMMSANDACGGASAFFGTTSRCSSTAYVSRLVSHVAASLTAAWSPDVARSSHCRDSSSAGGMGG